MTLSEDATILDVVRTLNKPVDYVRGVFENMIGYKKKYRSAFVRIGITGDGRMPHYRIEPDPDSFLTTVFGDGDGNIEKFFMAFNGSNHLKLVWGKRELRGAHWSHKYMDYDAVQKLLGELRGFKIKRS